MRSFGGRPILTEEGNWRDLVLFVSAVLFAVIAWEVDHHRPHWLPMFIAVILMALVVAIFALHTIVKSIRTAVPDHNERHSP